MGICKKNNFYMKHNFAFFVVALLAINQICSIRTNNNENRILAVSSQIAQPVEGHMNYSSNNEQNSQHFTPDAAKNNQDPTQNLNAMPQIDPNTLSGCINNQAIGVLGKPKNELDLKE